MSSSFELLNLEATEVFCPLYRQSSRTTSCPRSESGPMWRTAVTLDVADVGSAAMAMATEVHL